MRNYGDIKDILMIICFLPLLVRSYILFLVGLFSEEHNAEVHEEYCEDASPETSAAPDYCLKH